MELRTQEKGITSRYASLREELLREKNWVTPKFSRLHIFYAGMIVGAVLGATLGVIGVYGVYRAVIFFRGF